VGEGDVRLDQDRLMQAIQEEKKRKTGTFGEEERLKKKQKSGIEIGSHDITEEQLGMFCLFYTFYHSCLFRRGIPNDSSDAGRPYGKLRRYGSLALSFDTNILLYSYCFPK
jgi:ribosomal protein S8E